MQVKECRPNLNALNHVTLCHHERVDSCYLGKPASQTTCPDSSVQGGLLTIGTSHFKGKHKLNAAAAINKIRSLLKPPAARAQAGTASVSLTSLVVATSLLLAFTAIACFGIILVAG